MNKKLAEVFLELCSISSPSGREAKTAQWVEKYLNNLGLMTWYDASGRKNGSNTGNLYGYLRVNDRFQNLAFCAHLDTVCKEGDKIIPKFDGQSFFSDGKTILGADNRSGIACLLKAVLEIDKTKLKNNILLFFPTCEEKGKMGSSFFNPGMEIKYVFNIDESSKPGSFIYKSLGYLNFKLIVHGRSAHAAKAYEKGLNAILVAADLVKKLPLGRNLSEGWTLNVGRIEGGTNTNAVCEEVGIDGELRGFSTKMMDKLVVRLKKISLSVGKSHKTKIEVIVDEDSFISPLDGVKESLVAKVCSKAAKACKLKTLFDASFSTSDANSLAGLGYEVISVARGGSNPHSVKETIKLEELIKTVMLIKEIMYLG